MAWEAWGEFDAEPAVAEQSPATSSSGTTFKDTSHSTRGLQLTDFYVYLFFTLTCTLFRLRFVNGYVYVLTFMVTFTMFYVCVYVITFRRFSVYVCGFTCTSTYVLHLRRYVYVCFAFTLHYAKRRFARSFRGRRSNDREVESP